MWKTKGCLPVSVIVDRVCIDEDHWARSCSNNGPAEARRNVKWMLLQGVAVIVRVETVHGGIGRFQVINAREEEPTMVAQLPQQVLLLLVLGEWTCSLSTFYYIFRRRSSWPNRLPSRVPLKYSFDHPIVMSDRYARSFSSVSTRSSLETEHGEYRAATCYAAICFSERFPSYSRAKPLIEW